MRFPEPSEKTTSERETLPDGVHTVDITDAKERSIDGRDVMILTFTPADETYLPLDKFLDASREADLVLASQLRQAVGIPAGNDLFPDLLRGARVLITTKLAREKTGEPRLSKRGEPIIYVNEIASAETKKPSADRRPNTGAAKVAAARGEEAGGADEIPFMWLVPFIVAAIASGGVA